MAALGLCYDALSTTGAVPDADLARLSALQQQLHALATLLPVLLQVSPVDCLNLIGGSQCFARRLLGASGT